MPGGLKSDISCRAAGHRPWTQINTQVSLNSETSVDEGGPVALGNRHTLCPNSSQMIKLCGGLLAACIECMPKVSLNSP